MKIILEKTLDGDLLTFVAFFRLMISKSHILTTACCLLLAGSTVAALVAVQDIVDDVSDASYTNYLRDQLYTHAGDNRGFGAEHDLARDFIFNELSSFGLTTSYDQFGYNGGTYSNVVGTLPRCAQSTSDAVYVIGAHYDSVNNPGADDNASGVAAVLEAARVLSQYRFDAQIVFIAFDREEQGLLGSRNYAAGHNGDNIMGMISLDMIAYNGGNLNEAKIYGRASSDPVKHDLGAALLNYGGITPNYLGQFDRSDHAPFEWEGFMAAVLHEGTLSPNYHSQNDNVDVANYIDYDYATDMTRGIVGWLAESSEICCPEPSQALLIAVGLLSVMLQRRRG